VREQLCRAFCDEITVNDVPMGLAVSTGFAFPHGDKIGFFVKSDKISGLYELQDNGMTYPGLVAGGFDVKNRIRADALASLQFEYGVTLDEDESEFRLSDIEETDLPHAALRFVSFMLRVSDLLLLEEERVANTFRADVERRLREQIGDRAIIQVGVPLALGLEEFSPDFVIQAHDRKPVGVYLGTSDARVLEALFVQMRATYEAHIPCSVVAVIETERSIKGKVRQQAMNRLDAVLPFRGDEIGAIGRIAKEVTGEAYTLQ
jgi:Domain of unknown function DUF1828